MHHHQHHHGHQHQHSAKPRRDDPAAHYTEREIFRTMTKQEIEAIRSDVLDQINKELPHPEELDVVVPRLIEACTRDAREVRRSITAITSSQVGEAHRALHLLKESRAKVDDLRQCFIKQGSMISGMQTESSYNRLRQLHVYRENVTSVIRWTEALKDIHHAKYNDMLQNNEFLEVYKQLLQVLEVRKAVQSTSARYQRQQDVFQPYFQKLEVTVGVFALEVLNVFRTCVTTAIEAGLQEESEGRIPEFLALEQCAEICAREASNPMLDPNDPPLERSKIRELVKKSVSEVWVTQIMKDVVDSISEVGTMIEQMQSVEALMSVLESTLIPLSAKFPLFAMVVECLHEEVLSQVENYIRESDRIDTSQLIEVMKYCVWYKTMLEDGNYAQYVALHEIDHMAQELQRAAIGGMTEHMSTLANACAAETSKVDPTQMPNGQLVTTGPVDLFHILEQSLATISSTVDHEILRQLGVASAAAVERYLEECKSRSDTVAWEEVNKDKGVAVAEWVEKRRYCLYAFLNDLARIEADIEVIERKFEPVWDVEEESPVQLLLQKVPDYALFYIDEIIASVNRIVEDAWKAMFVDKTDSKVPVPDQSWASSSDANPTKLILGTLQDFFEADFKTMLNEQWYRKLELRTVEDFMKKYLNYLILTIRDTELSKAKDKWPKFAACLERDATWIVDFLRQHAGDRFVDASRGAIIVVVELLRVDSVAYFGTLIQQRILPEYMDCPTFVPQVIFDRRPDLDKAKRLELMACWKEKLAYQNRDKDDRPTEGDIRPSLFGTVNRRIATARKGFGFLNKQAKRDELEKEQKLKDEEEKKQKIAARQQKQQQQAAKQKKGRNVPHPPGGAAKGGGGGGAVDVETIDALFGK